MKCTVCARPATVEYASDWIGGPLACAKFWPYCAAHDPTRFKLRQRRIARNVGLWRQIDGVVRSRGRVGLFKS